MCELNVFCCVDINSGKYLLGLIKERRDCEAS